MPQCSIQRNNKNTLKIVLLLSSLASIRLLLLPSLSLTPSSHPDNDQPPPFPPPNVVRTTQKRRRETTTRASPTPRKNTSPPQPPAPTTPVSNHPFLNNNNNSHPTKGASSSSSNQNQLGVGKKTTAANSTPLLGSKQQRRIPATTTTTTVAAKKNDVGVMMLAFTNYDYRPLALKWYQRMITLGYNSSEVQLVAVDTQTFDSLQTAVVTVPTTTTKNDVVPTPNNGTTTSTTSTTTTTTTVTVPVNVQLARHGPTLTNSRQLFALRWRFVLQQLQAGIHVILADVDDIFVRYVPLESVFYLGPQHDNHNHKNHNHTMRPFDVVHTYGTKHPNAVFAQQGFVFCGCLTALRATAPTINYVQRIVHKCGNSCDDQQVFNHLYMEELQVVWDDNNNNNDNDDNNNDNNNMDNTTTAKTTTNHSSHHTSPRTTSRHWWFDDLPVQGRTGRSKVTQHTVAVWDRDFSHRGGFIGDDNDETTTCPNTRSNWVSMPNHHELKQAQQLVVQKMAQFDAWDEWCGTSPVGVGWNNGTVPQ